MNRLIVALLVMLGLPAMAGSPQEEEALNLTRDQKTQVQRGLKSMGHREAVGTADGVFGPRTRAAIAAWQKARGDLDGSDSPGYLDAEDVEVLVDAARVKLARFVCQEYALGDRVYVNSVAILDQLSFVALDRDFFTPAVIDGSMIIDPDHRKSYTDYVPFRLRIYEASLVRDGGSGFEPDEQLDEKSVRELAGRKPDLDSLGQPMGYTGVGQRMHSSFSFESTAPYSFTKIVTLHNLKDISGYIETVNTKRVFGSGDGNYFCKSMLISQE